MLPRLAIIILLIITGSPIIAQQRGAPRILAIYTGKNDLAHISFVREANLWFDRVSTENGLQYTSSQDRNYLQEDSLKQFAVVIFLDTRPDNPAHRRAFEHYMKNGGAWMGFHFAGFALTPSLYPQNWDWYHNEFLGSGSYVSNTWRPTSAILRIEDQHHPIARNLPKTFSSSPCEWYKWENDLRKNTSIKILASIDSASFPLGTGPKPHEIWHSGYYPVVWTNLDFNMVYFNMGHNDIDYEGRTNHELSQTFDNKNQDQLILNALLWLSSGKQKRSN